MPTANSPRKQDINDALAEWDEFNNPSAWRRSQRGNLWRTWGDKRATVFYRRGRYGWSINSDGAAEFSDTSFATEADAQYALGQALEIGIYHDHP